MNRSKKCALASATLIIVLMSLSFTMTTNASAYQVSEDAHNLTQCFGWAKITVNVQRTGQYMWKETVTVNWEDWLVFVIKDGMHWSTSPIIDIATLYIKDTDYGSIFFSHQLFEATSGIPTTTVADTWDVYYGSYTYGPISMPQGNYQAYVEWKPYNVPFDQYKGDWNYFNRPGPYPGIQSGGILPTFGTIGSYWKSDIVTFPVVAFWAPGSWNGPSR